MSTTTKKFKSTSVTIKEAFEFLQAMSFGDDPCGVKKYLEKWLNNSEMNSITALSRNEISPTLYNMLQHCQPTTTAVERSFSMLKKLLAKYRNFKQENVKQFIVLYYNKAYET